MLSGGVFYVRVAVQPAEPADFFERGGVSTGKLEFNLATRTRPARALFILRPARPLGNFVVSHAVLGIRFISRGPRERAEPAWRPVERPGEPRHQAVRRRDDAALYCFLAEFLQLTGAGRPEEAAARRPRPGRAGDRTRYSAIRSPDRHAPQRNTKWRQSSQPLPLAELGVVADRDNALVLLVGLHWRQPQDFIDVHQNTEPIEATKHRQRV